MKLWQRTAIAALLLWAGAVPAWAAPSMQVEMAHQGWVKPNSWATIMVELKNDGRDLEADLVVHPATNEWEPAPEFIVPVSLPAGATKRVPVQVQIKHGNGGKVFLRQDGDVLSEAKFTTSIMPMEASLIGVLADDELGIPGLAALAQSGGGGNQVIRLDAAGLPTRASMLESYSVIALSRTDTSELSAAQLSALESWVGRGGTMLLVGGPEWKRTFNMLPDSLLPVQITGVADADLAPLGEMAGTPLAATGPVSVGQLKEGAVALAQSGQTPLAAQKSVGAGKVVYLAADPGLTPIAGWQGQPALVQQLVGAMRVDASNWYGDPSYQIMDALQRMESLALPALWLVAALLIGYLVLVGPANYLLLKRLDKREWAWVTVPLISVIVVGSIYTVGFGRRTAMVSHVMTATELSAGTSRGITTSYVGVYAPMNESLTVELPGASAVAPIQMVSGPDNLRTGARVVAGEKTRLEYRGVNNYSMQSFSMEHDVSVSGGLSLVGVKYLDGTTFEAQVKNDLPQALTDVRVIHQGDFKSIGELAAGATSAPFTFDGSLMDLRNGPKGFIDNVYYQSADYGRQVFGQAVLGEMLMSTRNSLVISGWSSTPVGDAPPLELGRTESGPHLVYTNVTPPASGQPGYSTPAATISQMAEGKIMHPTPVGFMIEPGQYRWVLTQVGVDRSEVKEMTLIVPAYRFGPIQVKDHTSGQWVDFTMSDLALPLEPQRFLSERNQVEVRIDNRDHVEMSHPVLATKGGAR